MPPSRSTATALWTWSSFRVSSPTSTCGGRIRLRAPLFARLNAFDRVIRFDRRGTSLCERVADVATLEQRMDEVRAVMDAAGSSGAVVFGVSEGGGMTVLFAAACAFRVRALVLYGAYASYSAHVLSGERLARYLADIEAGWAPAFRSAGWRPRRWRTRCDDRAGVRWAPVG